MNQRLLVIRASGGMSNRLQGIAAGVGYCLLTGRALVVDWRDGIYSDDFSNTFPALFSLAGLTTGTTQQAENLLQTNEEAVHPPFWRQWLPEAVAVEYLFENDHLHPENVARTSLDFQRLDYPHPVLVGWGWDLKPALALAPLLRERFPRFSRDTDVDIVRRLIKEYIIPARDTMDAVDAFVAARFRPGHTVGIHIRHTDLQSPLELMLQKLRQVVGPKDAVFLATDNAHVETMVRRMYPEVITQKKSYPPHGDPLHSHVPGLSNVKKAREALLDMMLLGRCDQIIHYGPSSFARIPALISGLEQAYIHCVN